jgi:WD40 repeat protein
MPQKADPLPARQIEVIKRWIEAGAKFDGKDAKAPLASLVAAREHPNPPEVYRQPVPVTAIAYSPDGVTIAASGYREITLWSAAEGKLIGRIKGQPERTLGLCYSPDGKLLAAAGGIPGSMGEVRVIDLSKKDAGKVLERIADQMLAVRFSPDGSKIAAGGADNAVRVYDVASGKRDLFIEQHADWVTDLAWSPDGTKIASASRDKSARVFEAETGAVQSAYLGHEEIVFGIAWSDDGKNIFTAGRDKKVHEWPPATEPKAAGTIAGFAADPFRLVAVDGSLFVCGADGSVRQYKQADRSLVREYPKSADWVYCLAVDAKNHRLAAGTYGGQVRVFDLSSGEVAKEFVASPGLGKQ